MSHGHVTPNPGGLVARCGGPCMCGTCKQEWYTKYGAPYPYETEEALRAAIATGEETRFSEQHMQILGGLKYIHDNYGIEPPGLGGDPYAGD